MADPLATPILRDAAPALLRGAPDPALRLSARGPLPLTGTRSGCCCCLPSGVSARHRPPLSSPISTHRSCWPSSTISRRSGATPREPATPASPRCAPSWFAADHDPPPCRPSSALGVPRKRFRPADARVPVARGHARHPRRPDARAGLGQAGLALLHMQLQHRRQRLGDRRLRVAELVLDGAACVHLHGKGRKQRTVPLWRTTAGWYGSWTRRLQPESTPEVRCSPTATEHDDTNERHAASRAVRPDGGRRPTQLLGRDISPHTIRHTTAMHLLQSGEPIAGIALWLGHESPARHTGHRGRPGMKERALAQLQPPVTAMPRNRPPDALMDFLQSL